MKISVNKIFVLAMLVGVSAFWLNKVPVLWFADTLNTQEVQKKVSWYDESYAGEEYEISITNPNYDGIFVNINSFLIGATVSEEVAEKYIKDFLTLRRGPSARVFLKRICRTVAKEDLKDTDASYVASAVTQMVAEEPSVNVIGIREFVDEVMFPDTRYKRKLERARNVCSFIEEAHEFAGKRKKVATLEISVGFVRYLLQNNITYPIPGLLKDTELSDEMKALLLEYKHLQDIKPLINLIEKGNVSQASSKSDSAEISAPVPDLKPSLKKKVSSLKKTGRTRRNFSDKNLPPVADFGSPVKR